MKLCELLRLLCATRLGQWMRDLTIFERIRPCHHMDCVDEELGCDSRFFFVLAESEKAESRHDNDRWIGVPKFGRIAGGPLCVIFSVSCSIAINLVSNFTFENLNIFLG